MCFLCFMLNSQWSVSFGWKLLRTPLRQLNGARERTGAIAVSHPCSQEPYYILDGLHGFTPTQWGHF